jgi:hypothetical protein
MRSEMCAVYNDSMPGVRPSDPTMLELTSRLHHHHNEAIPASSDLDFLVNSINRMPRRS